MDTNANSRVLKIKRRLALSKKHGLCSYCKPHRGENRGRRDRSRGKRKGRDR